MLCRTFHFFRATALLLLGLLVFSTAALAQTPPAPDDPALVALLDARAAAESLIAQGDHVGAATVLTQSLRDCPSDRAELADAAYGNGQMASYFFLHVMQEAPAYDFLLNQIDPDTYVTDKMLKLLCFIAIGLDQAEKTDLSQAITYLTSSENVIVRIITRYYLSNPYFYANNSFTNQYAQMLAGEFPNLELTQISLNLSLYAKSLKAGVDGLAAEFDGSKSAAVPYKPWSRNLRARIQSSGTALNKKSFVSREAALAPLLEGIEKAEDWRERHFSLLLMKSEFEGELAPALQEAARALARRTENTPDVLQARVLLTNSLAAPSGSDAERAEALSLARTLLRVGVDETTPERVMWETRAYGIQSCADALAEAGQEREAVELYIALAEQLPGSKIADACYESASKFFFTKPLLLENAAE